MSNPKVGDWPVRIQCNLGTDISDASTKQIQVKKPNGVTIGPKTALFTTSSGTDGLVYYDTEDATILDRPGTWKAEPYVTDSGPQTFEFRGESASFVVDPALS